MRKVLAALPERILPQHHHDYLPACGYDRLLPLYDTLSRALGVPEVHRAMLEFAALAGGETVLEVGCGTGNLAAMARRRHPTINFVGVDPDPLALARAARKVGGTVRFDHGYAQALPYPDQTFAVALSALMVHHLDQTVRERTFSEIRRVLRPRGSVLIVDVGGHAEPSDDLHAQLSPRSPTGNSTKPQSIPTQLCAAGFGDCTELARQRTRFGRVIFYRATAPDPA